jgi:hypothetical protein
MLMFSRNSGASNGLSRDPSKMSSNKNGRNSYYEPPQSTSSSNKSSTTLLNSVGKKSVVAAATSTTTNGDESPTLMKRSSNRSTMKKSRPHSWHSTLQRGFQRARSRSSGRGERNRDVVTAAAGATASNGPKKNGKASL